MATQEGTQTLPFHAGSVNLHFHRVFCFPIRNYNRWTIEFCVYQCTVTLH